MSVHIKQPRSVTTTKHLQAPHPVLPKADGPLPPLNSQKSILLGQDEDSTGKPLARALPQGTAQVASENMTKSFFILYYCYY